MKKFYLVLALLFALSACSVGKKCTYTQDGTKLSSYVWFFNGDKPIDLDKNNCNQMNEKLITALLAILLALGGWTLQRTFSLSQDMVLIKTKVEIIEDEVQNFKNSKGKKKRKKKKKSGDQMDEISNILSNYWRAISCCVRISPSKKRIPWPKLA